MSLSHRPIPAVPHCPRARAVTRDIHRSYPTGRKHISRAFAGRAFRLTISSRHPFPVGIRANLVTTLNVAGTEKWLKVPFVLHDEKTLTCEIVPEKKGLYSFWTEYSLNDGASWTHDPVPDAWVLVDPPQVDQLRMYTLIPNVSGSFSDWAKDLARIKDLGFNAVHVLPLTTLDSSLSPYAAKKLFDVDPSYSDPNVDASPLSQLDRFVETAKSLGMRLCFDLVMNHVGTSSEIARNAPEWIIPDEESPDGLCRARYLSEHGWQRWNDLVLINFEHHSQHIRADIWSYMLEYALFWSKYASETDGFVRFDNLHSSDKGFIDLLTHKLHQIYPNVGIIAEYFTDVSTLLDSVPRWGLSLVLATPWDSRFVKPLRDYLNYIHSISSHVRFFMPITSHDSGTPAQEFGSELSTTPRYVAAALLGTGATGITQGVEWGQKQKIDFIGKQPRLKANSQPKFGNLLRKVNSILENEPAFRVGGNLQFVDDGHHAVIAAFRKESLPGRNGILVICNFDIMGEQQIEIDLSSLLGTKGPVKCVDLMTGESQAHPDARIRFKLEACGVRVLRF